MNRIALTTCAAWPELTDDDNLLIPALRQLNVEAVPVVWDESANWAQYDQVIIRSCWDYHLKTDEFLRWIENLEASCISVQNTPNLIRWNVDKRYLRQLLAAGVSIPPTVWVEDREEISTHEILEAHGWMSGIVKPTVSASAHNLRRVFKDEPLLHVKGPAIVQQFVPEIVSCGEWSLVFFGGEYSHAVIKRPTAGEFRVQWQFGGSAALAQPPDEMVDDAAKVIASLPGDPMYARIDGVDCAGKFVLMEVELIEPVLFLGLGNAANRLAEEIVERIS